MILEEDRLHFDNAMGKRCAANLIAIERLLSLLE